jgi:hypothetical protein
MRFAPEDYLKWPNVSGDRLQAFQVRKQKVGAFVSRRTPGEGDG